MREFYDMRRLLEREAAERIPARVPEADLAAIEALLSAWTAAAEQDAMADIVSNNKAFHERIYALCGNHFLTMAISQFAQRANFVRFSTSAEPAFVARGHDEHEAILEALRTPDRARLARLSVDHIMPSAERYIERRRLAEAAALGQPCAGLPGADLGDAPKRAQTGLADPGLRSQSKRERQVAM